MWTDYIINRGISIRIAVHIASESWLYHLRPCHCISTVGMKLAPIINAVITPELAAMPTLSNIDVNLSHGLANTSL